MSSGINAINFDMSDFAEQIEFDLRRYLKDPEPGIYYGRSRKPFMKPHASEAAYKGKKPAPYAVYETDAAGGTLIYPGYQSVVYIKPPTVSAEAAKLAVKKKPTETKTTPVTSIEDILKLGGDIHNHEGEVVLRCPQAGYSAEDFHHRPIVSTIGYDVIRSFMDYLFDSHVKFKNNRTALIGYVEQYFKIDEEVARHAEENQLDPADLRIEFFRATNKHANQPDSGVRVIHLTTGLIGECQDNPSQHDNKIRATAIVAGLLRERYREELTLHIEEMLRQILSPITDEVAKFIATDPWFIYIHRSRNSHDLTVYKTQDFRISEWTRLKEEGKI